MWLIRRPSGYWHIAMSSDGKRSTKSTGTKVKREAQRILAVEQRRQAQDGAYANEPAIAHVERIYFNWAEQHKQPQTVEDDRRAWAVFVDTFRPSRLSDVEAGMVAHTKRTLTTAGGGRWSPVTWNKWRRHMHAIYSACQRDIFIGHKPLYTGANPFSIRSMPSERRIYTVLAPDDVPRILTAAEERSRDIHLCVALALLAGMRKKEVQAARWEWVNFDSKTIQIASEPPHFRTKNGKSASVTLNRQLLEVLMRYRMPCGYIVQPGTEWRQGRNYRFSLDREFAEVRKAVGKDSLRFHDLRHSFVTILLQQGVSIEKVSKAARHSGVGITSGTYSHISGYDPQLEFEGVAVDAVLDSIPAEKLLEAIKRRTEGEG